MNQQKLKAVRTRWLNKHAPYNRLYYKDFDYKVLNNVMNYHKKGKGRKGTYNDVIIMADTETSKKYPEPYEEPTENHIVAWTISIRCFHLNICTLYGSKPSEMMEAFNKIVENMNGDETYIYFHNYAYDYVFCRKFFFDSWGYPVRSLNTKPHTPLFMTFEKGEKKITFKDSYILAQRSLEKWAKDMDVEHQKATGLWDYDKIRDQSGQFSDDELEYIEHDTLAGVECIDATLQQLNKTIYSIPYTATGIVRNDIKALSERNRGHDKFVRQALTYDLYTMALKVYHGGYTHANRFFIDVLIKGIDKTIRCFDFASSYPFCMLACKYPSSKFIKFPRDVNHKFILENSENYAYMFRISFINIRLKDDLLPMPALQESKCTGTINAIVDNGRICSAAYASIYLTEQDLEVIADQYIWDNMDQIDCAEVYVSNKDYLPRWFTDYIYALFIDKCKLKGVDNILYSIQKGKINSMYGLCCQRPIQDDVEENYQTGKFTVGIPYLEDETKEEYDKRNYDENVKKYNKFVNRRSSCLNYQIGVWVTAYAFKHLHMLGKCVNSYYKEDGKLKQPPTWYYSDTDSCYSDDWNMEEIEKYNQRCKDMLLANGYGPVIHNGKEYWLGVAESTDGEDEYTEFKVQGAKRYAGRNLETGKLKITVAGVPKEKGALCLNDDLNNFTANFCFDGTTTGKLTHYYIYKEDIYIDEYGNETGDSIDLKPCDYILDPTEKWDWDGEEDYYIQIYEEE